MRHFRFTFINSDTTELLESIATKGRHVNADVTVCTLTMNAGLQTYHLELVTFYVQTLTYLPTHYSRNPSLSQRHRLTNILILEKPITEKPIRLLLVIFGFGRRYRSLTNVHKCLHALRGGGLLCMY